LQQLVDNLHQPERFYACIMMQRYCDVTRTSCNTNYRGFNVHWSIAWQSIFFKIKYLFGRPMV
jgi:hypothetical protein